MARNINLKKGKGSDTKQSSTTKKKGYDYVTGNAPTNYHDAFNKATTPLLNAAIDLFSPSYIDPKEFAKKQEEKAKKSQKEKAEAEKKKTIKSFDKSIKGIKSAPSLEDVMSSSKKEKESKEETKKSDKKLTKEEYQDISNQLKQRWEEAGGDTIGWSSKEGTHKKSEQYLKDLGFELKDGFYEKDGFTTRLQKGGLYASDEDFTNLNTLAHRKTTGDKIRAMEEGRWRPNEDVEWNSLFGGGQIKGLESDKATGKLKPVRNEYVNPYEDATATNVPEIQQQEPTYSVNRYTPKQTRDFLSMAGQPVGGMDTAEQANQMYSVDRQQIRQPMQGLRMAKKMSESEYEEAAKEPTGIGQSSQAPQQEDGLPTIDEIMQSANNPAFEDFIKNQPGIFGDNDTAEMSMKYPSLTKEEEAILDDMDYLSVAGKQQVISDLIGKRNLKNWEDKRSAIINAYTAYAAQPGISQSQKDSINQMVNRAVVADSIRGLLKQQGAKGVNKISDEEIIKYLNENNKDTTSIMNGMVNGTIGADQGINYLLNPGQYKEDLAKESELISIEKEENISQNQGVWDLNKMNQLEKIGANLIGGFVKGLANTADFVLGDIPRVLNYLDNESGLDIMGDEFWNEWSDYVDAASESIKEALSTEEDSMAAKLGEFTEIGLEIYSTGGLGLFKHLPERLLKNKKIFGFLLKTAIGGGEAGLKYQLYEDIAQGAGLNVSEQGISPEGFSSIEEYEKTARDMILMEGIGNITKRGIQKMARKAGGGKLVETADALSKEQIDAIEKNVKTWGKTKNVKAPLETGKDAMLKDLESGANKYLTPLKEEKNGLVKELASKTDVKVEPTEAADLLNKKISSKDLGNIRVEFVDGKFKVVGESTKQGAKAELEEVVKMLNGSENVGNAAFIVDAESISKQTVKLSEKNPTMSKAISEWSSELGGKLSGEARVIGDKINELNKKMYPILSLKTNVENVSGKITSAMRGMELGENTLYQDLKELEKLGIISKNYADELYGTYYTQMLYKPSMMADVLNSEGIYPSKPGIAEWILGWIRDELRQATMNLRSLSGTPGTKEGIWGVISSLSNLGTKALGGQLLF